MRIHRNLHNARRGGPQWVSTVNGRVDEYLTEVVLLQVTTRIQPGGLARCKLQRKRDVCAFFDGGFCVDVPRSDSWQRVAFDPRQDKTFLADGQPWNKAEAAHLRADGSTFVLNPRLE